MLLAAMGWGVWQLVPSEEKVIRRRLTELAADASLRSNESPLAHLVNANKLRDYFIGDVEVDFELERRGPQHIRGRAELVQYATFARNNLRQAQFQLLDIEVTLNATGDSATASMTLLGDVDGEKNAISQEMKVTLKKIEGTWLIARVETVRTLR